jgi:hypothetical protein
MSGMKKRLLQGLFLVVLINSTGFAETGEKTFFPYGGSPEKNDMAGFTVSYGTSKLGFLMLIKNDDGKGNLSIKNELVIPGGRGDEDRVITCSSFCDFVLRLCGLNEEEFKIKEEHNVDKGEYVYHYFQKTSNNTKPYLSIKIYHDFNKTMWGLSKFIIEKKDKKGKVRTEEFTFVKGEKNVKEPPAEKEPPKKSPLEKLEEFCGGMGNNWATSARNGAFTFLLDSQMKGDLDFIRDKKQSDLDQILVKFLFTERSTDRDFVLMDQFFAAYVMMALDKNKLIPEVLEKIRKGEIPKECDTKIIGALLGYFGGNKYFKEYIQILSAKNKRAQKTILTALEFVNFNFNKPAEPPEDEKKLGAKVDKWLKWLKQNKDKKNIERLDKKINELIDSLKKYSDKDKKVMEINKYLLALSGAKLKDKLSDNPEKSIKAWKNWRKKNPEISKMPKKELLFNRNFLYKWLKNW